MSDEISATEREPLRARALHGMTLGFKAHARGVPG